MISKHPPAIPHNWLFSANHKYECPIIAISAWMREVGWQVMVESARVKVQCQLTQPDMQPDTHMAS